MGKHHTEDYKLSAVKFALRSETLLKPRKTRRRSPKVYRN